MPRQNCNSMAVFAVTVYSVFTNFNDTEYTSIMQLFRESNIVEGTVVRFYFEEKDEMNRWKRIEPSFNQM